MIVIYVVYQQFENHVIQVAIMARTVRLSPLGVLVSLLIGVQLFGLLGALLAIPAAGIIHVIGRDLYEERQARRRAEVDAADDPGATPGEGAAAPPAGALDAADPPTTGAPVPGSDGEGPPPAAEVPVAPATSAVTPDAGPAPAGPVAAPAPPTADAPAAAAGHHGRVDPPSWPELSVESPTPAAGS